MLRVCTASSKVMPGLPALVASRRFILQARRLISTSTALRAGDGDEPGDTISRPTKVLKARGLPFQASEQDIKSWFSPFTPVSVELETFPSNPNRKSGFAIVEFDSPETAIEALKVKDRGQLGTRYIELFFCNEVTKKLDYNITRKVLAGESVY